MLENGPSLIRRSIFGIFRYIFDFLAICVTFFECQKYNIPPQSIFQITKEEERCLTKNVK